MFGFRCHVLRVRSVLGSRLQASVVRRHVANFSLPVSRTQFRGSGVWNIWLFAHVVGTLAEGWRGLCVRTHQRAYEAIIEKAMWINNKGFGRRVGEDWAG